MANNKVDIGPWYEQYRESDETRDTLEKHFARPLLHEAVCNKELADQLIKELGQDSWDTFSTGNKVKQKIDELLEKEIVEKDASNDRE